MSASRPCHPALCGAWRRALGCAVALSALLAGVAGVAGPLPQRDLLVDLREADAVQPSTGAGAAGWNVRSADASAVRDRPAQQVRVQNGASATLRLTLTRPLQLWQAVPGALLPVAVPGTQWIESGQRLTVRPRWRGGREPVAVTVSAGASRLDPHVAPGSAELPQQSDATVITTVSAPLGQWVTLASTGAGDDGMSVIASGQAAASAQRVLMLRVSLAP